tara:strand:+ start:197 stop:655 length:459 start_codon:yes stop_codon:yes gene_type:complete
MANVAHRRIMAELRTFTAEEYTFNWYSNTSENIISIFYDNDTYEFKLLKTYPFTPPILYVNYIEYIKLIHSYWHLFKMDEIRGTTCICEKTLLCSNNWTPSINIKIILKEVLSTKAYFKTIYKLKYITPILNNNNIFENAIGDKIKNFILTI